MNDTAVINEIKQYIFANEQALNHYQESSYYSEDNSRLDDYIQYAYFIILNDKRELKYWLKHKTLKHEHV